MKCNLFNSPGQISMDIQIKVYVAVQPQEVQFQKAIHLISVHKAYGKNLFPKL